MLLAWNMQLAIKNAPKIKFILRMIKLIFMQVWRLSNEFLAPARRLRQQGGLLFFLSFTANLPAFFLNCIIGNDLAPPISGSKKPVASKK